MVAGPRFGIGGALRTFREDLMSFWDTVEKTAGNAWDSVSSVAHQGYDYFVNPNKWEREHFGTEGGLAPTPSTDIKSDQPTPTMNFPSSAQAVPEKGTPSPNTDLSWGDKQQLAKAGLLKKDEERMYGVKNWKNPVKVDQ
jgi:hypothetical protein